MEQETAPASRNAARALTQTAGTTVFGDEAAGGFHTALRRSLHSVPALLQSPLFSAIAVCSASHCGRERIYQSLVANPRVYDIKEAVQARVHHLGKRGGGRSPEHPRPHRPFP